MPKARTACLLYSLLLVLGSAPVLAAEGDARPLVLTHQLDKSEARAPDSAPARSAPHRETLPLRLTIALPGENQLRPQTLASAGLAGSRSGQWLHDTLIFMLAALSLLGGGGLLARWLLIMRRRADKPLQPAILTHAHWPVVSIVVAPRGGPATQAAQLRALAETDFGYPAERIHFVVPQAGNDDALNSAVATLQSRHEGCVHFLPPEGGSPRSEAWLIESALGSSSGDALVVLDQELPLPSDWLRGAVSPLLDPATALVISRCLLQEKKAGLAERLDLLCAHADVRMLDQADALTQLLSGKARIRSIRRQALKAITLPKGRKNEAQLAIELARQGWQAALLEGTSIHHHIAGSDWHPGLRCANALRSLLLLGCVLKPRFPRMARCQILRTLGTSIGVLTWQATLACGLALYFLGEPLAAGLAAMMCALTAFDPHGIPDFPLRVGLLARDEDLRDESRLLALMPLSHLSRQIRGLLPVRSINQAGMFPASHEDNSFTNGTT